MMQLLRSLQYSLHVIFHPFDGFWDLKHEKRGNVGSASVIILLLIAVLIFRQQLTGFEYNYAINSEVNIFTQIAYVLLPLLLWCISNWCIVSLVDGEGSLEDIYITTAYALVPTIILYAFMTFISNFLTLEESAYYAAFATLALIWSGFLLFCGIMTVHQFTAMKTILTILLAVVGMMVISFLSLLFFALIQQFLNFCYLVYREITLRL